MNYYPVNTDGGDKRYKLYVHIFQGKHFLSLTSDSGQYQEQQIALGAATQITQNVTAGADRPTVGAGLVRPNIRTESNYASRV